MTSTSKLSPDVEEKLSSAKEAPEPSSKKSSKKKAKLLRIVVFVLTGILALLLAYSAYAFWAKGQGVFCKLAPVHCLEKQLKQALGVKDFQELRKMLTPEVRKCLQEKLGEQEILEAIRQYKQLKKLDRVTLQKIQSCLSEEGNYYFITPPGDLDQSQPRTSGDLCDQEQVECTQLGNIWSGGTAVCRSDNSGYDVTGCTKKNLYQQAEMVKPATRDASHWANARCNDGSPFGFEIRPAPNKSNHWVINLRGGGFCDDNAISCAKRPPSHYSSPTGDDGELISYQWGKGIFNPSPLNNPVFHDVNHVFAWYCSSDSWTGVTDQRRPSDGDPENGWYFSGRLNVKAMLEILQQRYGLDDSNSETKVIFSGGSAGGFGVLQNADQVAELLPNTAQDGRLKLIADGAWLPHFNDPDFPVNQSSDSIELIAQKGYRYWGSSFLSTCKQAMQQANKEPYLCLFASEAYPYITKPKPEGLGLPLLIQVSSIDSSAIGRRHIDYDNPAHASVVEEWRTIMLDETSEVTWLFSNGEYPYHTILRFDGTKKGWEMGQDGRTFKELVTKFWNNQPPERVVYGNP